MVSAQCTIVKVAAVSLRKAPTGFAHSACPFRYIWRRSSSASGGWPTVNEQSPMPRLPISRWPSTLEVAPKIGGCGSWSGFGSTRRFGIDQYFPSRETSSCVQQATMCRSASSHIARVSVGSTPKPSSSARVDERPVPNSTRPFEIRSRTAADSAERTGWLYGFGSRRTP